MKKTFGLIALSAALLLVGCGVGGAEDSANVGASAACNITDYGQGVLYFDCRGAKFANGLSHYRASNPHMEIVSITGDGTGVKGVDIGYHVVVSPR